MNIEGLDFSSKEDFEKLNDFFMDREYRGKNGIAMVIPLQRFSYIYPYIDEKKNISKIIDSIEELDISNVNKFFFEAFLEDYGKYTGNFDLEVWISEFLSNPEKGYKSFETFVESTSKYKDRVFYNRDKKELLEDFLQMIEEVSESGETLFHSNAPYKRTYLSFMRMKRRIESVKEENVSIYTSICGYSFTNKEVSLLKEQLNNKKLSKELKSILLKVVLLLDKSKEESIHLEMDHKNLSDSLLEYGKKINDLLIKNGVYKMEHSPVDILYFIKRTSKNAQSSVSSFKYTCDFIMMFHRDLKNQDKVDIIQVLLGKLYDEYEAKGEENNINRQDIVDYVKAEILKLEE